MKAKDEQGREIPVDNGVSGEKQDGADNVTPIRPAESPADPNAQPPAAEGSEKEIPSESDDVYDSAVLLLLTTDGQILFSPDPPLKLNKVLNMDEMYGAICRAKAHLEARMNMNAMRQVVYEGLTEIPKVIIEQMRGDVAKGKQPKDRKTGLWKPGK